MDSEENLRGSVSLTHDTWLSNTAETDAWYGEPDEEAQRLREQRDERMLDEEMERWREEREDE